MPLKKNPAAPYLSISLFDIISHSLEHSGDVDRFAYDKKTDAYDSDYQKNRIGSGDASVHALEITVFKDQIGHENNEKRK